MPDTAVSLVWESDGFSVPESACYDSKRDLVYVSNMTERGFPPPEHGNGFISKLAADGTVLDRHWVTGLHQAKNIAVRGDQLLVADTGRLAVVDIESAAIIAEHPVPDSVFVDGVAVAADGVAYVGDLGTNTIWRLDEDQTWTPWLRDSALNQPDGLIAEPGRLVAVGFGRRGPFGVDTKLPNFGTINTIDRASGAVSPLGPGEPIGHLDGLCQDGRGGYLTTDSINGLLYQVREGEPARLVHRFPERSGPADLTYVEQHDLVLVALLWRDVVQALRVRPAMAG